MSSYRKQTIFKVSIEAEVLPENTQASSVCKRQVREDGFSHESAVPLGISTKDQGGQLPTEAEGTQGWQIPPESTQQSEKILLLGDEETGHTHQQSDAVVFSVFQNAPAVLL